MKNLFLSLSLSIITLFGCGSEMHTASNDTGDTGSAAFSLKWDTSQNFHMSLRAKGEAISELSYAPIDCSAIGVLTITANVYDSSNTYLINGGPWDCTAHSGTITSVPAGDSRKITIYGKDTSDRVIYRGNVTGVTITANQTTNAGSVTMSSVASDTTAPTDGTLSATAGSSQVSLSWSNFSDSGGIDYYKLVYSTSSTPSSCSSGAQIYLGSGTTYTHTGLTNGTTYYYRICATDNAGNISSGATTNATPSSSGTTTTTTTGSAPSAPTGVTATAGSSQVSISWSSVSGATSYNIYWSTTSGVTKTTGTKITGATSSYIHTGLTNGTTYYYVVTAVNSYGESSESSQVSRTPAILTVRVLVVAGGGGGGGSDYWNGGGGAGGLIYNASYTVSFSSYSVTVGVGGHNSTEPSPNNGGNSSFDTLTAIGGGVGGGRFGSGVNGGSGGGGGERATGGTGTSGQGNNGGSGANITGGGGGGASAAGTNGVNNYSGGNGGNGLQYNISGSNLYYSGGGGGDGPYPSGSNGLCDSGYGCGGHGGYNSGTQGVVIIRYTTGSINATISGGGSRTTVGGDTVDTFTSNGTWTVN